MADVLAHGISMFSLVNLKAFLRSAETQARAYATLLPARILIGVGGIIGQKKKENKKIRKEEKDRMTAVNSHCHLDLSNGSASFSQFTSRALSLLKKIGRFDICGNVESGFIAKLEMSRCNPHAAKHWLGHSSLVALSSQC